jgi:hypothetical protein
MKWTCAPAGLFIAVIVPSCLARPVGVEPPTTKVNFTATVSQRAVDKVDLLFMIDNSSSMGDKQAILAEAVPNLLKGLLRPHCVDSAGARIASQTLADPTSDKDHHYGCPNEGLGQSEPEFKPVTDLHVGILSSSLGNFGGDACPATKKRTNDHAHLINFKGTGVVDAAKPSNFLSWFPQTADNGDPAHHPAPANPIRTLEDLDTNFIDLVSGTGEEGCGLEAQLESIYHFLIQPDSSSIRRAMT